MPGADEAEIQDLVNKLTNTWRQGDAKGYGARY